MVGPCATHTLSYCPSLLAVHNLGAVLFSFAAPSEDLPKLISVCIDSGAEITVWPPELAPETRTEES